MARYLITGPPFTYLSGAGFPRHVPAVAWTTAILDTSLAEWDLPPDWQPPPVGLSPLDQNAADALILARAPYAGRGQIPGIGVVPINEPILEL